MARDAGSGSGEGAEGGGRATPVPLGMGGASSETIRPLDGRAGQGGAASGGASSAGDSDAGGTAGATTGGAPPDAGTRPDPALGACLPSCWSDVGCGDGRSCDPGGLGVCVDQAPAGRGVGAPCTPETEIEDCAGDSCLTFTNPDTGEIAGGFCTASCTFLSLFGCGFGPGSTDVRRAACLQEQLEGGGPGDLGFCFELCDIDADCVQTDWVCSGFNQELQQALGRAGQCIPAVLGAPTA